MEENKLSFVEETHQYFLDGRELPSVTTLLRPLSSSAYGTVNPSVLSAAAYRGTVVHQAIEWFNIFHIEDIMPEYKAYFDAYYEWCEEVQPEILKIEYKTYHPQLMYAGTVDLLCKIKDELWLVDYKTSHTVLEDIYRVQLEAYKQMLQAQGINVQRKMILHLTDAGKYKEIEFPAQDAKAWRVFGALKTIHDYAVK